ncbi:copper amine oxidase N-terminal domain-containing protein [Pelotomaculum propionicicum]|uniref:Copper amine oxidase-like N-terminal domain-containing protein n=1 Tax=Pelotomaculum propionicicum TaxID=258475 RepID=A0A4Y7RY90_9FIRM|nr:copper amine oxidase N-terminal domain-containing protein [Pelotomaculum propionicicum]TEB13612.1 hypothetical protein Pmgp_00012 [Pelotomaculum propionicicum]
MKAKRRILSILVTLSMVMALLVPLAGVAGAAAVTYTTTTTLPSFDPSEDADAITAATVEVNIDPYNNTTSKALLEVIDSSGKSLPIVSVNGTAVDAKIYQYTFVREGTIDRAAWQDLVIVFDGSDANTGEVQAKFSKCSGQLVGGTVTIANAKGGAIEVTVPSVVSISDAGCSASGDNAVTIRVNETVAGGFERGAESVKFKLPNGFKWNGAEFETLNKNVEGWDYDLLDNDRTLAVDNPGGYSGTVLLEIKAGLTVDSTVAKYGDVKVKISGESTVTPSDAVIATYGDYEATVSEVTTETVMSGQKEQDVGKFAIEEALPGTLVENRTIILTLPEQAKWDGDLYELSSGDSDNLGDFEIGDFEPVGTDNRSIKAVIETPSSGDEPTKIVFKNGQISVRADYTGDIILTVEGSAGAKGTVKIAEAKAPVTATAESKPEVIIGMGSQKAADITITETKEEALQATYEDTVLGEDADGDPVWLEGTAEAYLNIEAPPGVRFASVPTFTVTGDLEIGEALCDTDSQNVQVRIESTSTEPASIKVSDIELIVDRTVPEGDIKLKVGGTSLVENNISDLFPNINWVTKVAVAKVITPAPETTKVTTVFKIGDTKYTVNGVEKTADVAPYIKDDRTYLPIRYAAYAAGVTDSNIIWNAAEQSVVLVKGDRVVKLTVGSTSMLINGVPFAMDVAPEIVDPGRVMLPLRWVAQALGCQVNWDAATQSVTIN